MLANLQSFLSLSSMELGICLAVVLFAGIVRGFSGFALSALTMAGLEVEAVMRPDSHLLPAGVGR